MAGVQERTFFSSPGLAPSFVDYWPKWITEPLLQVLLETVVIAERRGTDLQDGLSAGSSVS